MESEKGIWVAFLGAIVRWALTAIFGGLVMRGVIDEGMMRNLTSDATIAAIVAAILGVIVPLAWSFYRKIEAKVREMVALRVSPSAPNPEQTVTKKTGEIPLPQKVSMVLGGSAAGGEQ